MPERITRVRRKRRRRSFPNLESFPLFKHHFSPTRVAVSLVAAVVLLGLGIILLNYGSQAYGQWREARLLKHANAKLQAKDFAGADQLARKVLHLHPDSLPAFSILADASEKQNLEETV